MIEILGWVFVGIGLVILYLFVGLQFAVRCAPLSCDRLVRYGEPGNVPFWVLMWPWPLAAEGWKQVTGKYPSWTPEV